MNRESIPIVLLGVLGNGTAHAAAGPTEGAWGIAFWVFIGYCSIVVIPQAIRALRFLLFAGKAREGKEATALKADAS